MISTISFSFEWWQVAILVVVWPFLSGFLMGFVRAAIDDLIKYRRKRKR